jgi:hypothetical protein
MKRVLKLAAALGTNREVMRWVRICSLGLGAATLHLNAYDDLSATALQMLQDSGGWQYVTVSDVDSGIQTTHTCFDGRPHPNACSGTVTFALDNTFAINMRIHGQSYRRHGTYELDDGQLSFFDELGTRDGPYTATVNTQTKRLTLEMPQVRMELELESQYRADMKANKQHAHK